jgi:membrane-associated phospholipid phosphatase
VSGEHEVVTQPAEEPVQEQPEPGQLPEQTAAQPRRRLPPGVLAPVLAAVGALAATILTWRIFVTTTRGQQTEEAARIGSDAAREALEGVTGPLLNVVSVPFLALVVVAAVLVSLVQRRWSIAVGAIVVLVGANLTTQVLQELLERPVDDASAIPLNSFPSGHATVAASIAATALLVVPDRWRPPVALLGVLVSASFGVATMIGDEVGAWHRGSDVAAAMFITATWYFAVEAVLAALAEKDGESEPERGSPTFLRVALRILTAVGGLCAALAVGALAATMVRVPITTAPGYQIAFLGSVLGVSAVACFTQATMLRLRPHHPRPLTGASLSTR